MLRFWAKASVGLALGWSVGGNAIALADPPPVTEGLQIQNSQSPLDAALKEEVFEHSPPHYSANPPQSNWYSSWVRQFGLPPMIGDFFPGYTRGVQQTNELDRLLVIADDLDAPATFTDLNQRLTITEAGPVGIFRNSLNSVQEIQAALRAGQTLTNPTQVGTINEDATLTTRQTIAGVQALLATTPGVGFDIIPLATPPGSYQSAVDAVFQANNSDGETVFDASTSGALLQGGVDTLNGGEDLDAFYYYAYLMRVNVPTPSAGTAGVGRSRIAENGTTTPQDRIFLDYGFFDRVGMISGDSNLNRYTPGFEKTIANGMASLELRVPMASTVGEHIVETGSISTDEVRLGNLSLYLKGLLYETNTAGLSGGLGVIFPTADGFDVSFVNGGRLVSIENESYHLQPFLGGYYAPNDQFFSQAFLQLDFDTNGNPVALNSTGAGLRDAGRLHDAAFLFLDWSVGYWITRGANAPQLPVSSLHEDGQVTQKYLHLGLAPTLELHYSRSLDNPEAVSAGPLQVGNFTDDVETLTIVLGTHLEIGRNTNIGLGYATSLSGGNDEPFDGALRVTLNQFFGRQ